MLRGVEKGFCLVSVITTSMNVRKERVPGNDKNKLN